MTADHDDDRLDETRSFKVLSPGTAISHYKILRKIGEGGMGVVYKAQDTRLDRVVALKFLPPPLLCDAEAKSRFEHEAKAASALNHPNISTIYEIDEAEGHCFIAMEYVDGRPIREINKDTSLSLAEILALCLQIAAGLNAAHNKGIVHRDIKPDNIMVTSDGLVKLMDFGLAKLRVATRLTKEGTTLGTLHYMSPEQAQGKDVDKRSDIFSFGVVLYEMIAGQLPFKGEYEQAVVYSIMNDIPEPLARYKAEVPEGTQRIVDKALAKDRGERYQDADDLLADLKHEKRLLESGEAARVSPAVTIHKLRERVLQLLIPAAVVTAAVLLLFVFEPFRIEMGPKKEAVARENSLAIMYFENLADRDDPEKIGEIVTNLLITDLSESRYMSVVSGQRLYDILSLLGKEGAKVVDRNVASEVATKAGASWMLLGSILRVEPQVILTARLVEVESGKVQASQRVSGEPGEQIFTVVDRLAVEIRDDLSLPAEAQEEPDRPVADVTTHSPEAYRYYLEGRYYDSKLYSGEAEESYRKALELDSTFAMAYYRLAEHTPWEESKELIAKAVDYSANTSWREQHYIRAAEGTRSEDTTQVIEELRKIIQRYPEDKEAVLTLGSAYYSRGENAEAVHYFERAIEIDPLYKLAYNSLAYAYYFLGDPDKAIWAINKYISLVPDEPNPYDTRGDLYRWDGKIDQAAQSYRKAVEIKPDLWESVANLAEMYLFKGEYAKAESCYQKIASSHEESWRRAQGRAYLALVPLYQGKFEEALAVLDDGIAADRMEKVEGTRQNMIKYGFKADIYAEKSDFDSALRAYEKYMEKFHKNFPGSKGYEREYYVQLLARNDDLQEAEEVANALRKDIDEKIEWEMSGYWYAAGCIELARGEYEAARVSFEKADKNSQDLRVPYMLGEACLKSGRLGDAAGNFEWILSSYSWRRAFEAIWVVKAHYKLGLSYERSGWNNKAIEQYEEFLELWKDADPGIPEIEDARQRSAQLKQAS